MRIYLDYRAYGEIACIVLSSIEMRAARAADRFEQLEKIAYPSDIENYGGFFSYYNNYCDQMRISHVYMSNIYNRR